MSSFVVTGASRGLGYEFISQYAAKQENVIIGLVRDKVSTDKKLQADNITNVTIIQADICDLQALEAAVNEVKNLTGGGLDYLINNAAYVSKISGLKSLVELRETPRILEEDLQKSFSINVIGVIKTINAFLPLILAGRAKKIITITSGMADGDLINNFSIAFAAPYSISKAGVNTAIAKYNAALGRSQGVLFMGISPGYVNTGNVSQSEGQEQDPEILKRSQELGDQFAAYAPHFTGASTPESSVKAIMEVVERSSVQNGDGGAFVSHLGNKQWL